jgi:hypothetical protein
LTYLCGFLSAQEYEVWGVWNLGRASDDVHCLNIPDGTFKFDRKAEVLIFFSNFNDRGPEILYNGGNYTIIEIVYTKEIKTVSFYIEEMQPDSQNGWSPMYAKIKMYFIDENHMWLEVDYNDSRYPTAPSFKSRYFNGPNYIYWREKSVS